MTARFHADAWYTTGDGHIVGQDYAIAHDGPGPQAIAIVSDGCSSSPDTDVGARLLARAALATGSERHSPCGSAAIWRAAAASEPLGLPAHALDATLLVAHAHDETIEISVRGDGVLAARRRDGTVEIWVVTHPQGAPYYPSYALDPARHREYLKVYGDCVKIEHRARDGRWHTESSRGEGRRFTLERAAYDLVLLASDGVLSFVGPPCSEDTHHHERQRDTDAAPVAVGCIIAGLLGVPRLHGRFLARRARRFVGKTCTARGWRPLDDVGIAAIAITHEGPQAPK